MIGFSAILLIVMPRRPSIDNTFTRGIRCVKWQGPVHSDLADIAQDPASHFHKGLVLPIDIKHGHANAFLQWPTHHRVGGFALSDVTK